MVEQVAEEEEYFEIPCLNDKDCYVNGENHICGCNTNRCGICISSGIDIQARYLADGKARIHYYHIKLSNI